MQTSWDSVLNLLATETPYPRHTAAYADPLAQYLTTGNPASQITEALSIKSSRMLV